MPVLDVSEIFYSIQGESTYAGFPCIFIRLSGCNLRCNYCDAVYTWDQGETQEIDSILTDICKYECNLVEVTGGEPLRQNSTPKLLTALIALDKKVLLETNGSISIEQVPEEVTIILDVKCPDSGSGNSFHPDNMALIRQKIKKTPRSCELKFVLSSRNDYLWAKSFVISQEVPPTLPVLFSPVQPRLPAAELASWILEDCLAVRLQLQLHTFLWPDISRGV